MSPRVRRGAVLSRGCEHAAYVPPTTGTFEKDIVNVGARRLGHLYGGPADLETFDQTIEIVDRLNDASLFRRLLRLPPPLPSQIHLSGAVTENISVDGNRGQSVGIRRSRLEVLKAMEMATRPVNGM